MNEKEEGHPRKDQSICQSTWILCVIGGQIIFKKKLLVSCTLIAGCFMVMAGTYPAIPHANHIVFNILRSFLFHHVV
jgi:hypothetical protein